MRLWYSLPLWRRLRKPKYPDLNTTQKKIFDDSAGFILGYGEKGSGKTIGFAHKLTRHLYEEENALVLIIAPSIRTGSEGIWHDLDTLVLPLWEEGIGLEYTEAKLDPNTKDRHRWIRNRFGGWTRHGGRGGCFLFEAELFLMG